VYSILKAYQIQPHFWICFGLGILNMLDAVITHVLLMNGARELNPLMNGARELNPLMSVLYAFHPVLFLVLKFIFSVLVVWCGFFPVHKNVRRISLIALIIYSWVVAWQLFLYFSI
jgi:Domain of unknown function (DUF5658)